VGIAVVILVGPILPGRNPIRILLSPALPQRVAAVRQPRKVAATISRVGDRLLITEPKSPRSQRTVPLSPPIVALLKAQRVMQAAERLHAGEEWTDSGLVFTTEFGTPVEPRNILRTIETAAAKAKIKGVGVHTLRHSAAVAWLEAGVHIKAVADLLGHSSIAITGDIYGHTSDATTRAAIDALSGVLGL
jgi:integrase